MATSTANVDEDAGHSAPVNADRTPDRAAVGDESLDISQTTSTNFKARVGAYVFSPVKPADNNNNNNNNVEKMTLKDGLLATRNLRKRRSESVSTATSTRSKRGAISASTSSAALTSAPTRRSSAKRGKVRRAHRSNDPYSPTNNLVDSIRPGLMLLMIGLNPGLKTAETGHAYAHPSNLFWKLMHSSGLTDRRCLPSETYDLMDLYSIGNTNLCLRPTRDGAGLGKEEMEAGVPILEEKVRAYRPEVVCIVGKGIWETILKVKVKMGARKQAKNEFNYGWQEECWWLGREVDDAGKVLWTGARTFVATTTSGLAANTKPAEKALIWKELGDWIVARRAEHVVKAEEGTDVDVD
jgi:mismatch-specific thymine-DNA glycosylase